MLALLFPGQGSQEVGMGRDAYEGSRAARAVFESADAALGYSLSKVCFEGPEQELRRTEVQQPAILTTSIALLRALEERSRVTAGFLAGHSLGEYTALVAGGSLPFDDAVRLVQARGRFMQEAVPEERGAMAAVLGATAERVVEACERARGETGAVVEVANFNAPEQTVVAGVPHAVERACALAREAGARRTVRLAVSAPFHCSLMAPAAEKLETELRRIHFTDPRPPVVTNVEATPNSEAARVADLLRRQVTSPVRFTETVRTLVRMGTSAVLEVGPGRVLSGLVGRIERGLARAHLDSLARLSSCADFVYQNR